MKYDVSRPMTRGAKRTLTAFSDEMLLFLTQKPFEEITVGELCEGAQYPRATFYNYFDDKYDLLEYCWQTLAAQIGLAEYHHAPENEMLYLYFDRIYDFTRENRSTVSQILFHNPENGYMVSSFRSFLNGQMREIFRKCTDAAEKEIPKDLLADHYSNTLFLVWQWSALKDVACTKEMGRKYLRMLLSNIGR